MTSFVSVLVIARYCEPCLHVTLVISFGSFFFFFNVVNYMERAHGEFRVLKVYVLRFVS